MKTLKKKLQKLQKVTKQIKTFLNRTYKNYITMKTNIKKILLVTCALIMCACGSTKVSVDRPAAGTCTTITVTTNNPITTEVNPNVELKNTK